MMVFHGVPDCLDDPGGGVAGARMPAGYVGMTAPFNGAVDSKRPKVGLEFYLYNIAAMLAGVGAGCDIRSSNTNMLQVRSHQRRSMISSSSSYQS